MAVIVERVTQHDAVINNGTQQIEMLERRIRSLELQVQILIDRRR